MKEIDARGLACPKPVILTRQVMLTGERDILVRVDNATAVENLKRLSDSQGYTVAVTGEEGDYALTLTGGGKALAEEVTTVVTNQARTAQSQTEAGTGPWAVFVGRDMVGDGDRELGTNLMRMYFYTLAEGDEAPTAILFMNGGVKLPTLDEQIAEHLKALAERGVKILVCGTCLNFYGLTEKLKVGTVSNMYDIVTEMGRWPKVVTL